MIDSIHNRVAANRDAIIFFLRDLVAIPSFDSNIRDVAARVERELRALGFRDIHYAPYGDIVAKIGNGKRILLYDSHLDTVGAGDAKAWKHGPFSGAIENGMMYGRGTVDEKGSTPPMIYGLKIAHDLGLLDNITAYYFGSIEEWCEGLSAQVFAEEEHVRPDFVVIGEPTNMRVVRGHKGRCEFRVTAKGRNAHGASHWLGDNAIYKMQELLRAIPELDARLPTDPFLGRGSIVATMIQAQGGSYNVVPDRCEIILDRRLTQGETAEQALAQVRALLPSSRFRNRISAIHPTQLQRLFARARADFSGVDICRITSVCACGNRDIAHFGLGHDDRQMEFFDERRVLGRHRRHSVGGLWSR